MSEPVGGVFDVVVLVLVVTPGESSACERACRLVSSVVLVGEGLDIASDDESLLCCECVSGLS